MKTGSDNLVVWVAGRRTGLLGTEDKYRHVFAYDPSTPDSDQVSLTMPVRLESLVSRDLHPVFQMNLPEGALLEAIRRAVAKLSGAFVIRMKNTGCQVSNSVTELAKRLSWHGKIS